MESTNSNKSATQYVLQPLLAIRVMLNPTTETQVLVDKLKMIRQIKVNIVYNLKSIITNSYI